MGIFLILAETGLGIKKTDKCISYLYTFAQPQ